MNRQNEKITWNIRLVIYSFLEAKDMISKVAFLSTRDRQKSQGAIAGHRNVVIDVKKFAHWGKAIKLCKYQQSIIEKVSFKFAEGVRSDEE